MRARDLPVISGKASLNEIINTMSEGRLGLALINQNNHTIGIITDGDLRRLLEAHGKDAWDLKAADFMTKNPKTVVLGTSLHETEERLKQLKITSLVVVDNNCNTVGVIQIYDLK